MTIMIRTQRLPRAKRLSRGDTAPFPPTPMNRLRTARINSRTQHRSSTFLGQRQLGHIDQGAAAPGFQTKLRELHAFRGLDKIPWERLIQGHVAQKELPLS